MTKEKASKMLKDDISMVFIDGSHTFESARNDYKCWKDKIKNGGILAIHDVYDSEKEYMLGLEVLLPGSVEPQQYARGCKLE